MGRGGVSSLLLLLPIEDGAGLTFFLKHKQIRQVYGLGEGSGFAQVVTTTCLRPTKSKTKKIRQVYKYFEVG